MTQHNSDRFAAAPPRNSVRLVNESGARTTRGKLKTIPEDFLVSECLVLPRTETGRYAYVRLRKSGYTTFEAVHRISDYFGVGRESVSFAGLKDEDGITEQTLAFDFPLDAGRCRSFNHDHALGDKRMEIHPDGQGNVAVVPGLLEGNSFRVTIRLLDKRAVTHFAVGRANEVSFLNYYDRQRFGVPGGPPVTHLVGRALLDGDHAKALAIVRELNSPESPGARNFDGVPRDYFDSLDPRVLSFYFSSAESADWNARLASVVRAAAGDTAEERAAPAGPIVFAPRERILPLILTHETLPYRRYRVADGRVVAEASARSVFVHTRLQCLSIEQDDIHKSSLMMTLSFFLPSGCYATMCMTSIMAAR